MTTNEAGQPSRRGPYAKSTDRRHAILAAAHAVFAAHGYRGVRCRMLPTTSE
ncbi:hypothetical protein ACW0JT_18620 [Arthrobacter sp. SA17]